MKMPNKAALHLEEDGELLGLMSYEMNERGLAVEVIYMESARHSNANLLHAEQEKTVSWDRQSPVCLRCGYIHEFGARQVGSYDPFRRVIWEDALAE